MRGWILLIALAGATAGCESDQKPSTMRQRQDAALNDPFNYSPYDSDRTDISGGGLLDFKRDAFRKDVNSVLGP
jgi:hypothetical protein